MSGMSADPGTRDETPPGTGGTGGTDSPKGTDAGGPGRESPPKSSRPRGRPDKLAKVEGRLNEMFATAAVAQSALGAMTGDQRHLIGGDVTAQLSPQLVSAWVKLARENPSVEKVLLRMSETSAWGEVILATGGFVYSQAQVYGAVPPTMPNPWATIPVPPSDDVREAQATPPPANWTPNGDEPITGRQPPQSGVDADVAARNEAERQRQEAERQRADMMRGRGGK